MHSFAMRNKLVMHWNYNANDKLSCAMHWIALFMMSIVGQCIEIALILIIIVFQCIGVSLLLISIIVQCIRIALLMISIVVQCIKNKLAMHMISAFVHCYLSTITLRIKLI